MSDWDYDRAEECVEAMSAGGVVEKLVQWADSHADFCMCREEGYSGKGHCVGCKDEVVIEAVRALIPKEVE